MARRQKRRPIRAREWQGFKDFGLVAELFDAWPAAGPLRDAAGNRALFFDQYARLMRLDDFNPLVDSLRGLPPITGLDDCGVG